MLFFSPVVEGSITCRRKLFCLEEMEKEWSRVKGSFLRVVGKGSFLRVVGKGSFFLEPQGKPGSRCPVAKMF